MKFHVAGTIVTFISLPFLIKFGVLVFLLVEIMLCFLSAHLLALMDTIKKYPNYYEIWKRWSEKSLNGRFYKLLVLAGFIISPTFEVELVMSDSNIDWGINYTKDMGDQNCVISVTNVINFFDDKENKNG